MRPQLAEGGYVFKKISYALTYTSDNMLEKAPFTDKKYVITLAFVTSLFLMWGLAITMADVLNKHFQHVLSLSKSQSAFVQFATFGAYFVMSVPAGLFMKRFGYKKGVLFGLTLFAGGAFLFVPAAYIASFGFFGMALFMMGCGMATLETVAHPFVASLGDQRSSDQRINFAQSFNAVGAMLGPFIGSYFLLRSNDPGINDLTSVRLLYLVIGIIIAAVAVLFSLVRVPVMKDSHTADIVTGTEKIELTPGKTLFGHRHFVWAVAAQFFNVAAQAGTWAFFINYGHEKMGFTDVKAGNFMVLFMGMMLIGRFAGTILMRSIAPPKLLAAFALCNMVMCLIVAQSFGWPSYIALLLINFFFSIMFPTIFSLGLKNLGPHTQQASSYISMALVGGGHFSFFDGKVCR